MSNLGEKVGCFNMHRFNLSMHILHVFIQEFEMFLNFIVASGTLLMPDCEARPDLNHVMRKLQEPYKNFVIAGVNESMLSLMP